MMTGVTTDHAHSHQTGHEGHGHAAHRPSIMQQFGRVRALVRTMGDLMANLDEQLSRLQTDVGNYVSLMRDKVSSLQSQINDLSGQVSTAAADQMSADAQALSDHLDALEASLAQDSPPSTDGGDTGNVPADPGTGDGGTDVPPAARRR